MPAIQKAVTAFFGKRPNQGVHPDEVVALGAALQGAALIGAQDREMLLLDVTPHALGIMTAGSHFEELIAQNTTVPTSSGKVFTTSRDNQTAVKILVMQGESKAAEHNELLGEFILTGLRQAPRGEVEVEVKFEIDTDGIVRVSAKDLETGQAQSIQVTASSGLTPDEISKMIGGAEQYLVERRSDERLELARQQIDLVSSEITRILPRVEELVGQSEFGRDAIAKAKAVLERAASAAKSGDTVAAQTELDALQRTERMFKGVIARTT
jgi:molecular chaperone DnaK